MYKNSLWGLRTNPYVEGTKSWPLQFYQKSRKGRKEDGDEERDGRLLLWSLITRGVWLAQGFENKWMFHYRKRFSVWGEV